MTPDRIKVLYIAGWGRSGSTILGNILAQIEGFFFVGESRLGAWSVRQGEPCGCGVPLTKCEVWTTVARMVLGEDHQTDVDRIFRLGEKVRSRHLPLMLVPWGRRLLASRVREELEALEKAYRAIQSAFGDRVIVDSSKVPAYAYMLGALPSVDLYVVLLVRDPRAVAYSWQRRKVLPNLADMKPRSPAASALFWNLFNLTTELLWARTPGRYALLRYEDFVDRPRESVERVLRLVDEDTGRLPFGAERDVQIHPSHTVTGNPVRMQTGWVQLGLDEEWKTRMERSHRLLVTALTWPLMSRYGYVGRAARA